MSLLLLFGGAAQRRLAVTADVSLTHDAVATTALTHDTSAAVSLRSATAAVTASTAEGEPSLPDSIAAEVSVP